jgi:hypothetical protein
VWKAPPESELKYIHSRSGRIAVDDFSQLGQAEVEQFHTAIVGHDDVSRLQIAVDDSGGVGARQCVGDLNSILQCIFQTQSTFPDVLVERLAWHELHGDEVGGTIRQICAADVVNVDDAGVIQGGGRFRLLHKAALTVG